MTINEEHRAIAQAAILKIADVQAMHAEFTERCADLLAYARQIQAKVNDEVRPVIYEAVGDNPVESGGNAQQFMMVHADRYVGVDAIRAINVLKDDIMGASGGGAWGLTVQAVAELERFAQGF